MRAGEMISRVCEIRRVDIWDVSGVGGGLLRGGLFQQILESQLPVRYKMLFFFPSCITHASADLTDDLIDMLTVEHLRSAKYRSVPLFGSCLVFELSC
jgi:hypothetical protein